MILVDTSICIDHFNKTEIGLVNLLNSGKVCIYPFIIGELSCGNISNLKEIPTLLKSLPQVESALDEAVFILIENKKLYDLGLDFIDIHLLSSALINKVTLWKRDKTLKKVAMNLNIYK